MGERTTMNISLPRSMRRWVEGQIASEGYGTASEYIRQLVREDQKRRVKAEVEGRLLEALQGGRPRTLGAADWERIRRAVRERSGTSRRRRAG